MKQHPQLYKSISEKPSMVAVDGPANGMWCNWNDVCAWIGSFVQNGRQGDELIVRFPRAAADEIEERARQL